MFDTRPARALIVMSTASSSDAAQSSVVTLEELRVVLSNPGDFALKEHVWFALDAPQPIIDMLPDITLAGRLGMDAAALQSLAESWLTESGQLVLGRGLRASSLASEFNGKRRHAGARLELSLTRSRRWLKAPGDQRQLEVIRWVLYGTAGAEDTALQQLLQLEELVLLEAARARAEAEAQADGQSTMQQAASQAAARAAASAVVAVRDRLLVRAAPATLTRTKLDAYRRDVENAPTEELFARAGADHAASEAMEAEAAAAEAEEAAAAAVAAPSGSAQCKKAMRSWQPAGEDNARTQRTHERRAAQTQAQAAQARVEADKKAEAARRAAADAEEVERRNRECEEVRLAEAARYNAGMAAAAAKAEKEAAAKRLAEKAAMRRSVGDILAALLPAGVTPVSANGEPVPQYLLEAKFLLSYAGCENAVKKRRLLAAASVLVFTVLEQLSPDPLLTAQLLVEWRASRTADPLRLRLMAAAAAPPKGRRMLELLAS